jgi:ABC-type lipoprotein release transport system permease subunit/ABC-type Zn uptake system ZnuABC Zn-binding protein ZnuA
LNLAFYIARRYLFAKKSQNAINIISMISAGSIMVATVALVCGLSVMNGFGDMVEWTFNNFDPELKITPTKGKVFDPNTTSFQLIRAMPEIDFSAEIIEENVFVRYRERQEVAVAKGVSDNFRQMAGIDSVLFTGEFKLQDGDVNCAVLGIGLASVLGVRAGFADPIEIYAPVRDRQVSIANVLSSFEFEYAFAVGEFMVNQAEYDEKYMFLPLELLRDLLHYETEVTALELKVKPQANLKTVQKQIRSILGDDFNVQDRYEQQESTYKMLQIEKWMTFLILAFISMIALFNLVSSISMLMIEKQEDVRILRSMGADDRLIRRIFIYEGSMIPAFGALTGILIGVILCLIQQLYGVIKLGEMGAFISNHYPVRVSLFDLLVIFITVCTIGFLATWYPVRYHGKKWLSQGRLALLFPPFLSFLIRFPLLPLFSLFPLFLSCQSAQTGGKPSVAVTIEPQRYFTEKIAGEQFEVFAVVPVGQSPETYDPAPHEMIRIAQSKAYLQIGRIGFEQVWMQTIRQNNPHLTFFDLSEGVHLIGDDTLHEEEDEDDDHHTHSHHGVDPHIWSATGSAKIIAQNTLKAFMVLDPDNQNVYLDNYGQLIGKIEETELQLHAMLDTLSHRTFVIFHPALTYFADEYDLKQLSIESDGKEPSVASLKTLIDEAKNAQVRVVFVQQEFDRKHAEQVAAEIGARVVVINPLDRQWNEQMIHIARELIK